MKYVLTDAAVRKLRGVLAPRSGNTGAGGAATPVSPDDFPPPFTVRWAQSENSGSGAWVIWLPDPARLLFYDEEWRTINQITAAQTMPAGWFTMNSIRDQDRTVYLSVRDTRREGSTGGLVEANISRIDSQGGSGGDYFYCGKVAVMEVDSDTGARRVKQLINSAVEIAKNGTGGGGGGLSGTVEFVADNDWYVNGSVHQFRKRLRVLDLATGQVTDKAGTTYANGWEVVTDTTPISQIIN